MYYCDMAKTVCQETNDETHEDKWGDCVRKCLQDEDKKSCGDDSNKRQSTTGIVTSHLSCWAKCAADPDANPFNGGKQNNDPWDSCW